MTKPKPAQEVKLLNCPFCGSEPKLFKVSWHGWYVGCSKDNITCVCLKYVPTKEEAITAWNTRTPDLGKRIFKLACKNGGYYADGNDKTKFCIELDDLKQIIAKVQG